MNRIHLSILAGVLAAGISSTTFAAANPFSDVPAGHWAYDAVTQLAAEGIIEGYGDGTYIGNRNITRYEMAQMIAKAMAKNPVGTDRSRDWNLKMLEAEFADELNNLGVRVSNLEKYADKMKWKGELRYTYTSERKERANGSTNKSNKDDLLFRFEPKAEVNKHWSVNARIDAKADMSKDTSSAFSLKRAWAQGDYNNLTVKVGRLPDTVKYDKDMMFFNELSGAELDIGNKPFTVQLRAGRISWDETKFKTTLTKNNDEGAANFQSAALIYEPSKLNLAAVYYHLTADWFKNVNYSDDADTDKANIWEVAGGYRFDKNVALAGAYANNTSADHYDHSHMIELDYKGAKAANQGSWGVYAAYRYLGANTSIDPNTNGVMNNTKGWETGFKYIPLKNIQFHGIYFNGKQLSNDRDTSKIFGRIQCFF
ncbi:MAG: S-layer homology domain-containing protein [Selenomonadaceae bacterium]|nr:S-layer homology domain-containing protein [Selenomonadaceae bacterium]